MRLMNKSDDEIMAWGRWSSDAYKRYVRDCLSNMISKSTLMDAPEDIGSSANSDEPTSTTVDGGSSSGLDHQRVEALHKVPASQTRFPR